MVAVKKLRASQYQSKSSFIKTARVRTALYSRHHDVLTAMPVRLWVEKHLSGRTWIILTYCRSLASLTTFPNFPVQSAWSFYGQNTGASASTSSLTP